MSTDQPTIINKTENEISTQWLQELQNAIATSYDILRELEELGYPYKRVRCVEIDNIAEPLWIGESRTQGRVKINPSEHDARAVAHELGHGFHEKIRDKGKEDEYGEDMAEAIRWFVEKKMGPTNWCKQPPNDDAVIRVCNKDKATFIFMLKNGQLFEKLNWS